MTIISGMPAVDSADQDGVEHIRRARLPVKEPKKSEGFR